MLPRWPGAAMLRAATPRRLAASPPGKPPSAKGLTINRAGPSESVNR